VSFARALLTTATLVAVIVACSGHGARAPAPMTDAQRLDDEIERTDRDARAQIPPSFDRRLVGSWSCRGYGWIHGQAYTLSFRSNGTGTDSYRTGGPKAGGQTTSDSFIFGTFGASLYEYTRGSMPSDERYSIRHQTLTVEGNLFWREDDGWFAAPDVSKGICRRAYLHDTAS